VVVQGVGPQGIAAVLAAHMGGARMVIATGLARDHERLAAARRFGADHVVNVEEQDAVAVVRELTHRQLADVVVDVTGSPRALETSILMAGLQSTVVCAGLTERDCALTLAMNHLAHNEVRLQGAFTRGADAITESIRLIESRQYPLEELV